MEEICIVSYGGVFPDAKNPTELFQNLMSGKRSIHDFRELPEKDAFYHPLNFYYDPNKKARNKTYSSMGAFLDRRWTVEYAKKYNLDHDRVTSSEIFAIEAAEQTLAPLRGKIDLKKFEIIIGMASIDHECLANIEMDLLDNEIKMPKDLPEYKKIISSLKKSKVPKQRFMCSTYILDTIRKHFNIGGPSFFVDAACASSLASIFCAQQRLRSGEAEFVLAGGLECNLSPFLEVMFAKAGVLSDKLISPFDSRADGMNHGEAVAFLALCTLSTAIKNNLNIHGVIKNCQGSSDGLKGGATEPTLDGQMLAYRRTYPSGVPEKIHYFEAHGTGTSVGDRTEIQSLQRFFNGGAPVGSIKANIGHTIGTAGTASIIKCLEIIKHRVVPPAKYFMSFPNTFKTDFFINTNPYELPKDEKLYFGISSFGFGGTNYHLSLTEVPSGQTNKNDFNLKQEPVYLCATEEVDFSDIQKLLEKSKIRIPPKAIPQIDAMVLAGILGIDKLISRTGIYLDYEVKKQTAVISAGSLTLDNAWRLYQSLALDRLSNELSDSSYAEKINILKSESPEFTADTGPGILNNLIAGRAAKMFDFKGCTMHVDADLLSRPISYALAANIARDQKTAVFVLSAIEKYDSEIMQFVRKGLRVDLFADTQTVAASDLPKIYEVEKISYEV